MVIEEEGLHMPCLLGVLPQHQSPSGPRPGFPPHPMPGKPHGLHTPLVLQEWARIVIKYYAWYVHFYTHFFAHSSHNSFIFQKSNGIMPKNVTVYVQMLFDYAQKPSDYIRDILLLS
ncbi:hypothetical protein L3Y34_019178 [Caenorhabditis briggsae]|uniref:Uncharacterized protein n=1 Tax=Caenorhabditis briggsae TaxID=6238 RepID=A0AAE9DM82_CAEBR|nr:hypothetical protein L3Y34_019178 [Caenorhabditis briggsae]